MAEVNKLERVFKFNNRMLKDPDETLSTDDVLDFYSNQYPELTNSKVSGPIVKNDVLEYEFTTSVGTKG